MYESTFNPSGGRLIHGLDGTRDLVDLIMNPVYHEADRFSYLLEHSLLLGDVCPIVLESNLQANSSGSAYRSLSRSILGKPLACYYNLPPPVHHHPCNSSSSILLRQQQPCPPREWCSCEARPIKRPPSQSVIRHRTPLQAV